MTRYSKMIVAAVGAVCTWATTYFPNNHNVQIVVGLAVALVTVASVYLVPNTTGTGAHRKDSGYSLIELMFALVLLVVALVVLFHFL